MHIKPLPNAFFDWLSVYQDYDFELPRIGERGFIQIDLVTGEVGNAIKTPTIKHEGSYSTSLDIRVAGNRIYMEGNPSRFSRLDNLFGFTSIDDCIRVFNHVLLSFGLPPFTKCTRVWHCQSQEDGKHRRVSDGAVITRLDVTTNKAVGQGCVLDYLRGLSSLPYRHSVPRLHTNGRTVDWLSKEGNAPLVYSGVYDKAYDLQTKIMPKVKKLYGADSTEYRYLSDLAAFCEEQGVARFEQKIKSEYLRREHLNFYGLGDLTQLVPLHDEFLSIDSRLQVTAMSFENIAERLLRSAVVDTTKAANTTAMYAVQWMHGQRFDFDKKAVQTHRARLRKIGIDIAMACDITKFSPVFVREAREVIVKPLPVPAWYRPAQVPTLMRVA